MCGFAAPRRISYTSYENHSNRNGINFTFAQRFAVVNLETTLCRALNVAILERLNFKFNPAVASGNIAANTIFFKNFHRRNQIRDVCFDAIGIYRHVPVFMCRL